MSVGDLSRGEAWYSWDGPSGGAGRKLAAELLGVEVTRSRVQGDCCGTLGAAWCLHRPGEGQGRSRPVGGQFSGGHAGAEVLGAAMSVATG